MKTCSNCGASNADAAKFCNECGTALAPVELVKSMVSPDAAPKAVDPASLARSIAAKAEALQGRRRADIMFVLDCTGSMQGEIDAIKDTITAFADTIESEGVRVRVGLIEFRDRLIGEEPRVLTFAGQPFTNDPAAFRREVSALQATGGGDAPESSLDAVMLALRQPFAPDANKVIVLVTDAPPHVPDKDTQSVEEVVQAIRGAGVQQFYLIVRTQDPQSQVYLKLLEGTRGMAFELGTGDDFRSRAEDFKKTLMALGKTISAGTR
ncbi:MAG: VWA domain-containing protein [Abditibacteriales bacterium]|nr:VWA domain-containing protein [Abditibacteriales bacterium]MDW8367719.1 VWA domain-containing protein [Abditibacteriales bacterium]